MPAWRGRRIDTIAKHDVLVLLDAIVDRGAPAKAQRAYVHAHRLFKWCVGRGIVDVNPMAGLERPGRENSRDRVLTDTELAAVWQASADWPFGAIVRLLVLTGARREEIGQLTWGEVQGDTIRLEGARTKSGNGHLIPLSPPALELLGSAPRIGEKYVFTLDGIKPVSSSWSRAKARLDKASGVAGWRIHDLRRTVATGMQRLGVGLQTVEALLGHTGGSRAGIVGIYQRHDFAAEKRAAVEQWGAHVTAWSGGGDGDLERQLARLSLSSSAIAKRRSGKRGATEVQKAIAEGNSVTYTSGGKVIVRDSGFDKAIVGVPRR